MLRCQTFTEIDGKIAKQTDKLPNSVTLPHSLATYQELIKEIKLHAFGDASGHGVSAAIYAVVTQESGVTSLVFPNKG